MSFIAYATGSELIYGRYKKLLKKMAIITFMITLSIYVLCSVVLQFLLGSETARNNLGLALANCVVDDGTETLSREQVEQCRVMEALSTDSSLRWAISLLIGAILTSRSPASAISIVGEMRANGDFTKTTLGVTIFMYLGVILLFSVTQAVSVILVSAVRPAVLATNATLVGSTNATSIVGVEDEAASAANVGLIIASVITSLLLSIVVGLLLGVVLYGIIGLPIRPLLKKLARLRSPLHELYIKACASLLLGMAIFMLRLAAPSKSPSSRCSSSCSPAVPSRRAPGGSGQRGTPRARPQPRSAQPPPQVLERAASKDADFTCFDTVGAALPTQSEANGGRARRVACSGQSLPRDVVRALRRAADLTSQGACRAAQSSRCPQPPSP